MKLKKAQIEMGETIFIVIIIIILILMGMVFLTRVEERESYKKGEEFFELGSVAQAQLVSSLPELSDSSLGVKEQISFDKLKLISFQNLTKNNPDLATEYYFDRLGYINITIKQIYPKNATGGNDFWELYVSDYNVEPTDLITIGTMMMLPISIYDPIQNQKYFGMLYITNYRRK